MKTRWRALSASLFLVSLLGCQSEETTRFTLLDATATGVTFANTVTESEAINVLKYGYFYNGGGVAAGDFNNDGLVDLYFTGNMTADRLYLNKGGMQFEDVTEVAGINHGGWKTGVSLVDINDDGWLDIYICRSTADDPELRRNLLYVNQKNGKFIEQAAHYGLDDDSYSTQAAFFDYDHDGDLDCFLLNHSVQEYAGFSNLIASYREKSDTRYGSKLLRNDEGKFTDATATSGLVSNVLSFGLGLNVSDLNNDGWLDLYVTNDYNENDYLYLNQQNGTFKEVVRGAMGHTSFYSMGTDAADINNDGRMDIITLDMLPEPNDRIKLTAGDDNYDKYQMLLRSGFHDQTMRNMLQLNLGTAGSSPNTGKAMLPEFSEIGQLAGISNTDWSWAALFADFDNDGLKDLFVTNGYARDYTNMEFLKFSTDKQIEIQNGAAMPTQMEIINSMPAISEPNYIFKNKDGLTFEKKTQAWGFAQKSQSNGAAYADLDNDGDLDLVTNNINERAFIYQNNTRTSDDRPDSTLFAQIVLKAPNEALKIGAKVVVWAADKAYYQEFQPVRGFQSAMYGPLHFGLGKAQKIDSITVSWTDGKKSILPNPEPSRLLEADYKTAHAKNKPGSPTILPYFTATNVPYTHDQIQIDDFKIQPLLPEMRSYTGPCVAQGDVNGDGRQDVYAGGGRGQAGVLFLQTASGFTKSPQTAFDADLDFEDAAATFFDADGDGDLDLLVASSGYALAANHPLLQPRLYLNQNGKFTKSSAVPALLVNARTVAHADVDGDGDQDIFIGASSVPGRYPESQASVLWLNDGRGNFTVNSSFTFSGLVTGAEFSDLNNDQQPDLLLVGEWMKPTVLINQKGTFTENQDFTNNLNTTLAYTLHKVDLDGDGDDDFVIGSAGLNTQYNITSNQGLKMYYGDFGENGQVVPLLSQLKDGREYPYASRDELLNQVPRLRKKFQDYIGYSAATINDIFESDALGQPQSLSARELQSGILWNDSGKLTFEPLPIEAQFAPIHAITTGDVNGDGKQDLILAGNVTHTRVRLGKSDANKGQVYINQGNRKFTLLPQALSGLWVNGDVRAVAMAGNYLWMGINGQSWRNYSLKSPQMQKEAVSVGYQLHFFTQQNPEWPLLPQQRRLEQATHLRQRPPHPNLTKRPIHRRPHP
ncbi:MAG: VCBS repeat-containing protein [Bacteroidetes bacterium]|nr:VCBS repeat-containing protein [Bacteroidota bacterium]